MFVFVFTFLQPVRYLLPKSVQQKLFVNIITTPVPSRKFYKATVQRQQQWNNINTLSILRPFIGFNLCAHISFTYWVQIKSTTV